MLTLLSLFLACSDAPSNSTKDCAPCPECPKQAASESSKTPTLTDSEMDLLSESLADIRAGIRGFDDKSIGVCRGSGKNCEEFLGRETADLPEGNYVLYAKLLAPKNQKGEGLESGLQQRMQNHQKEQKW